MRDRRRKQTPRKQQCFRPPWAPPHPHTPSRTPASLARTFRPPTEAALALSPQAGAAAQAPAESTAQHTLRRSQSCPEEVSERHRPEAYSHVLSKQL